MQKGFTLIEGLVVIAILGILAAIILGARDIKSKQIQVTSPVEVSVGRFKIESQGSFNAGHNNNKREILLITDSETGKRYLAVTGCGVSEMLPKGHEE